MTENILLLTENQRTLLRSQCRVIFNFFSLSAAPWLFSAALKLFPGFSQQFQKRQKIQIARAWHLSVSLFWNPYDFTDNLRFHCLIYMLFFCARFAVAQSFDNLAFFCQQLCGLLLCAMKKRWRDEKKLCLPFFRRKNECFLSAMSRAFASGDLNFPSLLKSKSWQTSIPFRYHINLCNIVHSKVETVKESGSILFVLLYMSSSFGLLGLKLCYFLRLRKKELLAKLNKFTKLQEILLKRQPKIFVIFLVCSASRD